MYEKGQGKRQHDRAITPKEDGGAGEIWREANLSSKRGVKTKDLYGSGHKGLADFFVVITPTCSHYFDYGHFAPVCQSSSTL